ncbi:MAG: (d)CMP kinase [bacterium]|nr:(d)CMP kinase [bacterium]
MNKKVLHIAVDGPGGSGKGTLCVELAKKLKILYIYTGGMYRALALASLRAGINVNNNEEVQKLFKNSSIELKSMDSDTRVFLDGEDVSDEIFLPKVALVVPVIAAFPEIRKEMVKRQKELIKGKNAVIEGRDITTVIAPDADLKIYLTADVKIRAKRRHEQFLKRGINKSFEDVLTDTQERDKKDTEREASPLSVAKDAVIIDTTNDSIENTVEKVMNILKKRDLV